MKKNGVNIIAILATALVAMVAGVFLFWESRSTKGNTDDPNGDGLGAVDYAGEALALEDIEQFREFAEVGSYECYVLDDNSVGSVYRAPLLGEETVITYYFDDQGKTTDFQAFYYLNANILDEENMTVEEITLEEIATKVRDIVERFCLMFSCDFVPDIYLTNTDRTFSLIQSDTDFQKIADGSSILTFSIRAKDGYFWELTISSAEELISAQITKYFNVEETMSYVANISLYEEE